MKNIYKTIKSVLEAVSTKQLYDARIKSLDAQLKSLDAQLKPPQQKKAVDLQAKGLKGNEEMKQAEMDREDAKTAQSELLRNREAKMSRGMRSTSTPMTSEKPSAPPAPVAKPAAPPTSSTAPAPKTSVTREAEKSGPDVESMKKDIIPSSVEREKQVQRIMKYVTPEVDTVSATNKNAASETPVENPSADETTKNNILKTITKTKKEPAMESNVNKKFNVSDALYQSVMEVMKSDKKEGSIPRNDKEKELAKAYGDPKRITHGDVLKMRGVTKEEAEQANEGIMDKVLPILTGGSDKDLLKKLQKDMGVPQTGEKPAPAPAKPVKENKDTPGNGYAHQCAVHVKSESFGEGRTITTQHADPDADGNIAWYDVMFEHGIEKQVPTSTLEILVSENHMHMKKKKM
jgi:hypothetical protein